MFPCAATRTLRIWEANTGALHTPVIAVTANNSEDDQVKYAQNGADGLVRRPPSGATPGAPGASAAQMDDAARAVVLTTRLLPLRRVLFLVQMSKPVKFARLMEDLCMFMDVSKRMSTASVALATAPAPRRLL